MPDNGEKFSRILISVPKKHFKRAVKRNLLKRRIRECWRRLKHELIMDEGGQDILLIYSTKEVMTYQEIHSHIMTIINRLNERQVKQKNDETVGE